jgi:surface protein
MNVTNMKAMFLYSTAFDKDISEWNVSSVIDMSQMFQGATSFNCGGGGAPTTPHQVPNPYESETNVLLWKTSALTNTKQMFSDASSFNIPLYLYMDLVTDMSFMFQGATSFNQNLEENYGYWVTSGALNMRYMFYGATSFANGGIAWMAWQTNNVTNMSAMFFNTPLFNADITSWTTNNVTDMNSMFYQATAFNQNIGVWNISNVVNFSNFMGTKTPLTLSTTNLNGIYNGWASRPVKPNINISFGSAKRTAASNTGRSILVVANLWNITDGGI